MPTAADHDPLILTLILDERSQASLDAQRAAYFPAGRNHLSAHVTMFHALPGSEVETVTADLTEVVGRPGFAVGVSGVRFLGRGVAYDLTSPELLVVRAELAARWSPWLTRQDQQRFRPHVTVQNKVAPAEARALAAALTADFAPWAAQGTGLALWRYRGGPWDPVRVFRLGTQKAGP